MAGRPPRPALRADARKPQPGLTEIDLVNDGQDDADLRVDVWVRWADARRVAGDAVNGFRQSQSGAGAIRLIGGEGRLRPRQRITIGWVRFDKDTEVQVDVQPIHP
jgi:hypothetical protein